MTITKKEKQEIITCPLCGYQNIIKKGTRKHVTGKTVIRYLCKTCGHKFTPQQTTVPSRGKKHQTGKTIIDLDRTRKAFKPGLRKVIHKDANGKVLSETEYYEYRRNRTDINPAKRV